jgi:hypothetical protein
MGEDLHHQLNFNEGLHKQAKFPPGCANAFFQDPRHFESPCHEGSDHARSLAGLGAIKQTLASLLGSPDGYGRQLNGRRIPYLIVYHSNNPRPWWWFLINEQGHDSAKGTTKLLR